MQIWHSVVPDMENSQSQRFRTRPKNEEKRGEKKDHERRRMDTRERIPGNAEFKFTVNEKLRPMWKYLRIY